MQTPVALHAVLTWSVACGSVGGVLFRPKDWPEAVWPCAGAALLMACGLIAPGAALHAAAMGLDVYLFLTGMMLLAELARREGVFDWLAGAAVTAAGDSRARLFALVYAVGALVTVFLSNDATAVVLTPAVLAAVRRARGNALPYAFACAFIANAASFVLPISNPANLVLYGSALPPLAPWLRTFLPASLCSIAATYAALRWISRAELRGPIEASGEAPRLTAEGRRAAWGLALAGATLIAASWRGVALGLPTCAAALAALALATRLRASTLRQVAGGMAWSVLPLVAGLFILVEALNGVGALNGAAAFLRMCAALPALGGSLAASFGLAAASNVMNNLPSGLLTAAAARAAHAPALVRDAALIGVDLGPNLSVSGSLATILWLIALRREGITMSGWRFLKTGAVVMTPALLVATVALVLTSR
jgi:arsenical pump membrane protein